MTMHEFLAEAQVRAPVDKDDPTVYAGGLTRAQVEELAKWAEEE